MYKSKKKDDERALTIALKELKSLRREKQIEMFFFSMLVLSTTFLLVFLLSSFLFTGFASLTSQAGYITSVTLTNVRPTFYWHGLTGIALRVAGFGSQISSDLTTGEISYVGAFFDCIQNDATGGREMYISNVSSINFNTLEPANLTLLDSLMGCSGSNDCASATFSNNMTIYVGETPISDVPSTYTYRYDGSQETFEVGALTDGTNFVFVTLLDDIQLGYTENTTVNYQMLIPMPANTTDRFYFFVDPNDECPAGGGVGETVVANITGYITNSNGDPVENARVVFVGQVNYSDSDGFYNTSAQVYIGTYNVLVLADGYDDYVFNVTVNYTNYSFQRNITLSAETPGGSTVTFISPTISGYVTDSNGNDLSDVTVVVGNDSDQTTSTGFYSVNPSFFPGNHSLIGYKSGYDNYYYIINFTSGVSSYSHNFSMDVVNSYTTNNTNTGAGSYSTGPYTQEPQEGQYDIQQIIQEVEDTGEDYWINTKSIYQEVRQGTFIKETIAIYNFQGATKDVTFAISPELEGIVELDSTTLSVPANTLGEVGITFYGIEALGEYNGTIELRGGVEYDIPTIVKIVEPRQTVETLLIDVELLKESVARGEELRYKTTLHNLLSGHNYEVYLKKYLTDENGSLSHYLGEERVEIKNSYSFLDTAVIPDFFPDGPYQVKLEASYLNYYTTVVAPFTVRTPIYLYSFFGIPVWVILLIIALFSLGFLLYFLYKHEMNKRKRYGSGVDYSALPQKQEDTITLGRIAETKVPAYLQLGNLTTHAIVAGATGGGKSISAQVLVEEVLMKDVAVIVFDPTAQWSGMLRKCDDKRMMSFYPKFGLKKTDARAFPGSIRMVTDEREQIDITKYMEPGKIQIFAMNKLEPAKIDIFVANVIRQIFKSDPKEYPKLKVLLVFDEVHRLLSKFGGSGEGFLQIERACREFRKWGLGVMLVSQVLSDFVGEIKANINTEIQMRTIEETDLERIKTKYGPEYLKSLVKSEVGVGMFQNAEYNRGKPYFLNFRPILHNTRRLSDEELEKYNDYNNRADTIEFHIEELEKLKVDVFDLKMELKLIKDKIMTGNFSVVDIYLQGLEPRIAKQFEKLGKTPPKLQKKLVDLADIKKSVAEAKEEHAKAEVKAPASTAQKPATTSGAKSTSAPTAKPTTASTAKAASAPAAKKKVVKKIIKKVVKKK